MKRICFVLLLLTLLLPLAACGREEKRPETAAAPSTETALTETGEIAATEETEEEPETEEIAPPGEEELRELVEKNLDCVLSIFDGGYLQYDTTPTENKLHKVTDPRFADFAALESFVRSVYIETEADELLYRQVVPGHTLYVNLDGELYIDEAAMANKGYYVDWSNFDLTVVAVSGGSCRFTVTAALIEPGPVAERKPYVRAGEAIYENDAWRLNGTIL